MNEPGNHTAWVDRHGDTWVRADDMPGARGPWWPLTDGPGWDEWARGGIGGSFRWEWMDKYAPFTEADPARLARALARVRREFEQ